MKLHIKRVFLDQTKQKSEDSGFMTHDYHNPSYSYGLIDAKHRFSTPAHHQQII